MKHIVQCITNNVTINDCANAVLAVGASPIMAHHIEEVGEVQSFASALLLNLGATDDYEAMTKALEVAYSLGHPVVLDPVGVSGIRFRRDFAMKLLGMGGITCIRGNYNEIMAIMDGVSTAAGLDYDRDNKIAATDNELIYILSKRMKKFAKDNKLILVASGVTDIVTDGDEVVCLECGDVMMSSITGSGCMASAIVAASLAKKSGLASVAYAMENYGKCGSKAANLTKAADRGIGTFHQNFLDELSLAKW